MSLNGWSVSVALYSVSVSGHSLSGELHSLRTSVHSLSVSVSELLEYRRKSLVVHLQTVELNILDASGLVEATLRIMEKIRADDNMMGNQIESSIIFGQKTRN